MSPTQCPCCVFVRIRVDFKQKKAKITRPEQDKIHFPNAYTQEVQGSRGKRFHGRQGRRFLLSYCSAIFNRDMLVNWLSWGRGRGEFDL